MGEDEVTLQLRTKLNVLPEWHKYFCIYHSLVIKENCTTTTIAVAIISNW